MSKKIFIDCGGHDDIVSRLKSKIRPQEWDALGFHVIGEKHGSDS